MPKIADLTISDNGRNKYIFQVYPKASNFDDDAGVYMFTERSVSHHGGGTHEILYIGETQSFRDRPLGWGHHKWEAANRLGVTHICVLRIDSRANRVTIQNRLIAAHQPPLNENEFG